MKLALVGGVGVSVKLLDLGDIDHAGNKNKNVWLPFHNMQYSAGEVAIHVHMSFTRQGIKALNSLHAQFTRNSNTVHAQ